MQETKDFIKWGTISRHLARNRSSITSKRIPKIHKSKIKELTDFIDNWKNSTSE